MRRKLLSLTLVLLMCLTLLPATALAEDSDFTIKNGVLTKYSGSGGDVVIPITVTAIGSAAFYNCTSLKSVTIPDSVTSIGTMAFQNCTGLRSVTIGSGVTAISNQTFYGCTGLESLTIGSGVTYIGKMAFSRCTSLTSVVIPAGVTYIDDDAFYGCTALARVTIPDGAVVSDFAFYGCTSLPEGALSGSAASYDELAQAQVQVGDFVISNGVLMQYTGSGGDVVIPAGVTFLYHGAFSRCAGLESVTIPDSVIKIGVGVFSDCANLRRVVFPEAGKAAKELKYANIFDMFKSCPAMEELVNCPDPAVSECLAINESLIAAWSDPSPCVTPQSERVTTLSNQICAGLTSDYKKAKAVFEWMTTNIEYDYDYFEHRKETVTIYPKDVLDSRLTVCEGYARLTQAFLQAQGIPTLYVSGTATNVQGPHAWNLAFADGRWIYIDSTWGRQGVPISSEAEAGYKYDPSWFDPTPLSASLSHKAEASYVDPNAPHYSGAGDTPTTAGGFSDVPTGEYYAVPVAWAVKNAITNGTSATTFSPEKVCTTGEILTFLWKAQNSPEPAISNPFSDAAESSYYYKAALWAYEKGLVSGSAFGANVPCTRSMTVTYLWKLAGSPAAGGNSFSDIPDSADYAEAVAWAVSKGITGGTGSNTFSPDMTCTRGQIMTFLYRDFAK